MLELAHSKTKLPTMGDVNVLFSNKVDSCLDENKSTGTGKLVMNNANGSMEISVVGLVDW